VKIILAKAYQGFYYQILQLKQEAIQLTSHSYEWPLALAELPLALASGQRD